MDRTETGEMSYSIGVRDGFVLLDKKGGGGSCSCMVSGLPHLILWLGASEDIRIGQQLVKDHLNLHYSSKRVQPSPQSPPLCSGNQSCLDRKPEANTWLSLSPGLLLT